MHKFEFTLEQRRLLASLALETGRPIPALIAEALEGLQEHMQRGHVRHDEHGHRDRVSTVPSARLPVDGAAQHDHYIYDTPKRPA